MRRSRRPSPHAAASAVNGEFRYLEPAFAGALNLDLLPYDQVYEDTRYWLTFDHVGRLGDDAALRRARRARVGRRLVERLPAPPRWR